MSLDISLLHFRIDERSVTLKLSGLISESSVVMPVLSSCSYTGGCIVGVMTTLSVCTPTSEENMCRFSGFCERGPRTEERWLLRGDQMRTIQKRKNLRDPSRTPLEMPLHTTIRGLELQVSHRGH